MRSVLAIAAFVVAALAQNPLPVPQYTSNFENYGALAKASLNASATGACPHPPGNWTLLQIITNTTTNYSSTIFRNKQTQGVALVFTPTENIQGYLSDGSIAQVPWNPSGRCPNCQVHSGFLNEYLSVRQRSIDAIKALGVKSFQIVGGSLGGAVAALAYADFKYSFTSIPVSVVYTFGEPRVGNPAWSTFVDGITGQTNASTSFVYYRVTHDQDPVPQLPPRVGNTAYTYQQIQTEFYEKDRNFAERATLANGVYRCYGDEPSNCVNGAGYDLTFQDHMNYMGAFLPGATCYN